MAVVQTVLGAVDPNVLGRTLTHEHLSINFGKCYVDGPEEFKPFLKKKIALDNIGYVRQYPYASMENLKFCDNDAQEAVLKDVLLYKQFGGGAIVENSSHGLSRDLEFMVDVSKKSGVHIIAGTGHYLHFFQQSQQLNMKVEELTDFYSKEIINGVELDRVGVVKCGFIGEVGSGYPLHDFEKRSIRATGEIQEVLGCGVSFHPGRDSEAPFEIMRLYLEAGGKANKAVLSHLDRTILDIDKLLEFGKFGCYLQYDLFGTEVSYYQLNPVVDMPSDAQRINNLIKLIDEGYLERLTLSHDVHTKHRLTSYGGHGFHHLHMNVLPRLFERGLTLEQIERITVTNPAEWLKFNP